MHRRAWGAVVLAVGLIVAVAVPAALGFGRQVAGAAVRAPIPGAPVPGDCLHAPLVRNGSPMSFVEFSIGTAPVGPCAPGDNPDVTDGTQNYGEIVSVTPGVLAPRANIAGRLGSAGPGLCGQGAADYLGWTAHPWTPVLVDAVSLVGPDTEQYLGGQRWLACAVVTGDHGYRGSVRDGRAGAVADLYGRCDDTRSSPVLRVWCFQPHDTEVFGSAVVENGAADLTTSCLGLVTQRTGMSDPTDGGLLRVSAAAVKPPGWPTIVAQPGELQAIACAVTVTGGRLLTASLVGAGGGPLPWA